MKITLSTFRIKQDNIASNVDQLIQTVLEIVRETGIDIIMFPEDCFTCLGITDNPEFDIKLGRSLNSEEISKIKNVAQKANVFINFGFLEIYKNKLFDSSVMIDNNGQVIFIHRRIHQGWFNQSLDSNFYGSGFELVKIETTLGSFVILICGEITDENLLIKTRELKADFLLFPFLRASECFSEDWLMEEMDYYTKQISKTNTLGFMLNGLSPDNGYFGGAWIVSPKGEILKKMETLSEGYLVYDTKG